MKSFTSTLLAAIVGVAPFVGMPLITGCETNGHVAVYPGHQDVVAYTPGYYYDNEYYDPAGHFHARQYYYYDGHHWDNRDAVPSGYTARARHEAHERHDVHDEHHDHNVN